MNAKGDARTSLAGGAQSERGAPILHPSRVRGRLLAKTLAAAAQQACLARGDDACTDGALGRRLGIARQQVARLFETADAKPLHLGDLFALPRELAREILVRAIGALEDGAGPGPRVTLAQLTIELGRAVEDLERDLADGRIDDTARHKAHLCKIGTLALRGYLGLGGEGVP